LPSNTFVSTRKYERLAVVLDDIERRIAAFKADLTVADYEKKTEAWIISDAIVAVLNELTIGAGGYPDRRPSPEGELLCERAKKMLDGFRSDNPRFVDWA
jgi:hypothetical protein